MFCHQAHSYDLEVTSLDLNLISDEKITNLFQIVNSEYYQNKTISEVTLEYNVSFNNKIIASEKLAFPDFKYKKYSGTGSFIVKENGKYMVCGKIYSNISEDNYSNNKICTEYETLDTNVECDFEPNIWIEDSQRIVEGNQLRFKIYVNEYTNNSELPYIAEYWIEDVFGNIIKKKINTTNTLFKTFTIKSINPTTLILKSKLYSYSCNDKNIDNNQDIEVILMRNTTTRFEPLEIKDINIIGNYVFVDIKAFNNGTKNNIKIWLESNDKKISNDFELSVLSRNEPFEFKVPIFFSSNEQNARLVIDAFGERFERIIQINKPSKNSEKANKTIFTGNLFKTENVINSHKVNLDIKKVLFPALASLVTSISIVAKA